jgi:oligopeptide/dipeptide ABC transporter ATP-binding protein
MSEQPVLEVRGLVKHYTSGSAFAARRVVRAVDGVDLTIGRGEILGLVGESGSGKSTVGKCVARLTTPTAGTIKLLGRDITHLSRRQMRPLRTGVHMVFQDPFSSLNPRMTIGDIVAEPLRQHSRGTRRERTQLASEMLERTGLAAEIRARYPHELSGGQRQRAALARALVLRPALVVADEPVSALDVSVQASILNAILDLQVDMGFSCLFITHDLSVVRFISDRITVMYFGKIMESAPCEDMFNDPQHPYSQALLSAAPPADPSQARTRHERVILEGESPSASEEVAGCSFNTRCPLVIDRCLIERPMLAGITAPDHLCACHLATPEDGGPDIRNGRQYVHHTA